MHLFICIALQMLCKMVFFCVFVASFSMIFNHIFFYKNRKIFIDFFPAMINDKTSNFITEVVKYQS
jgi:hypothetical protein